MFFIQHSYINIIELYYKSILSVPYSFITLLYIYIYLKKKKKKKKK